MRLQHIEDGNQIKRKDLKAPKINLLVLIMERKLKRIKSNKRNKKK